MQENPKEIEVPATFALDQFEKPFQKRVHNYKKMRPIGEGVAMANNMGFTNLESPELLNMIKEQAKAELEAEIRAQIIAEQKEASGEKPKKKKKSEDVDTYDLDNI
jgi:hypothetical protein